MPRPRPLAPVSPPRSAQAGWLGRVWNLIASGQGAGENRGGAARRRLARRVAFFRPLRLEQYEARLALDGSPPVGNNDGYSVTHDHTLAVTSSWSGVLANDYDMDGGTLTASLVSGPSQGALSFSGDGTFTYTPPAHWAGSTSFTYTVTDGVVTSSPITATINVQNYAPSGSSDGFSLTHDQALNVTSYYSGVLANDYDMDSDTLTAALVSSPSQGTLSFNSDGTFTYNPPAHWAGSTSFTYTVTDGVVTSSPITATINVQNYAPSGYSDGFSLTHDQVLNVTSYYSGVLANDYDMDSDTLTAALVSSPSQGTLSFNADGTFTYTPTAHWAGSTSFTYTVTDGVVTSSPITATINVQNYAPSGYSDGFSLTHDQVLNVTSYYSGVLANDYDMNGDTLTAALVSSPSQGTLSFNANGTFTYTPTAHWAGSTSFTYTVTDGVVTSSPITAIINVQDYIPSGSNIYKTIDEDELLAIADIRDDASASDMDDSRSSLIAILVSAPSAPGSFTFNANGSVTFLPALGWFGSTSFQYKFSDGVTQNGLQVNSDVYTALIHVAEVPLSGMIAISTATVVEGSERPWTRAHSGICRSLANI